MSPKQISGYPEGATNRELLQACVSIIAYVQKDQVVGPTAHLALSDAIRALNDAGMWVLDETESPL